MQNSAAAADSAAASILSNFKCLCGKGFANPLDLLDHPLLLDIFFLGAFLLRTGLGFFFFFKVSFMKHPNVYVYDTL